jgi:hypothetical protein
MGRVLYENAFHPRLFAFWSKPTIPAPYGDAQPVPIVLAGGCTLGEDATGATACRRCIRLPTSVAR